MFKEALKAFLAAKIDHGKANANLGMILGSVQTSPEEREEKLREAAKEYCRTRRVFDASIDALEDAAYANE